MILSREDRLPSGFGITLFRVTLCREVVSLCMAHYTIKKVSLIEIFYFPNYSPLPAESNNRSVLLEQSMEQWNKYVEQISKYVDRTLCGSAIV